jgi:ankyrin repeat protein
MIKDGANINALDNNNNNLGFFCNNLEILKLLVENGLDIKRKNKYGKTMLNYIEDKNIIRYAEKIM